MPPRENNPLIPAHHRPFLQFLAEQANALGVELYVVGGYPRNLLLQFYADDFDMVVVGNALAFAEHLQRMFGGELTTHVPFGTAAWRIPQERLSEILRDGDDQPPHDYDPVVAMPEILEFATTRTEIYSHPAALPMVTLISGENALERDAQRRDFTINTFAFRLAPEPFGQLLDPLNAMSDLEAKTLRVLHERSLMDDPTRLFRAARLMGRYQLRLAPETQALISAALPYLNELSGERIRHELDLIMVYDLSHRMLRLLDMWGVFAALDIGLHFSERLNQLFSDSFFEIDIITDRAQASWVLWASQLTDTAPLLARLPFDRHTLENIRAARKIPALISQLDVLHRNSEIYRILRNVSEPVLAAAQAVAIAEGYQTASEAIRLYYQDLQNMSPKINGNDLINLGLKPSPFLGKLLSRLQDAVLDGVVTTSEEQRALVTQWIAEEAASSESHDRQ